MGAIVVKASGKINGNCFRTFRGQQLLTRLALPTKTNLFRSNPQNGIMAQVFRAWALLTPSDRDLWVIIASVNPVIDIWGNPKLLSGREYYTRVSSAALLNGYSLPLASTFDKTLTVLVCTLVTIDMAGRAMFFESIDTTFTGKLEVKMVKLPNDVNNYGIDKVKFALSIDAAIYEDSSYLFDAVDDKVKFVLNSWYQIYMCFVNESGVRGQYLSFKVQAK